MRIRPILIALCGLILSTIAGCRDSTPAPATPEPAGITKAEELKKLDGSWLLKASSLASERGTYALNPNENGEKILRIHEGLAEMRTGNGSWLKYGRFAIGNEPFCLLCYKMDTSGQERAIPLRYKFEGETLITVQDHMYPDMLPESFEMGLAAADRQRQTDTYVKTNR
jgi:hypothetical protein